WRIISGISPGFFANSRAWLNATAAASRKSSELSQAVRLMLVEQIPPGALRAASTDNYQKVLEHMLMHFYHWTPERVTALTRLEYDEAIAVMLPLWVMENRGKLG